MRHVSDLIAYTTYSVYEQDGTYFAVNRNRVSHIEANSLAELKEKLEDTADTAAFTNEFAIAQEITRNGNIKNAGEMLANYKNEVSS